MNASVTQLTAKRIEHTLSPLEIKLSSHSPAGLVAETARELYRKLEAAGLLNGSLVITLETKEGD